MANIDQKEIHPCTYEPRKLSYGKLSNGMATSRFNGFIMIFLSCLGDQLLLPQKVEYTLIKISIREPYVFYVSS